MIIQMLQGKEVCKKYDLRSVRFVFSGAAPLGEETMKELEQLIPSSTVAQAYGEFRTFCRRSDCEALNQWCRNDRDVCRCVGAKRARCCQTDSWVSAASL
jgi:acyl-CoA synthetase (AMP-forming)/AMP-acid ligase II